MDLLEGLNPQQKQAVINTEGYIRVIAGAGSGKTRALAYRYAYLVEKLGIPPRNILCVTFTNKAANEMKGRIRKLIGEQDTMYIGTFHSFCVQILKEDIYRLQYPRQFLILDLEDQKDVIGSIYTDMGLKLKDCPFKEILSYIEYRKQDDGYISLMEDLDDHRLEQMVSEANSQKEEIFCRYLYAQKKSYGLDFNDLIYYTLYLFESYPDSLEKWQRRLQYIMVDEFQDVSGKEYRLVNYLSGYYHNLYVVGDPDQTIYSWRMADVRFILDFDKVHPTAQTYYLTTNYRSTPEILEASNALISKNKKRLPKELIPVRSSMKKPIYFHGKDGAEEAGWIITQISTLMEKGIPGGDIAVLYRSHFVSRQLEEVLIRTKIPYVIYSGTGFYERTEIKVALSYLRLLCREDDYSFLRVINTPKRNIGVKRIDFLKEYAAQNNVTLYQALTATIGEPIFQKTKARDFLRLIEYLKALSVECQVSTLLSETLKLTGYEAQLRLSGDQDRLDNLAELKRSVLERESQAGEEVTLEDYLGDIALYTNADRRNSADAVRLMTVHTAKGLEFPYVFVCGLNEGIFPNKHIRSMDEMEEERRLAYVAYTRAEIQLFLSDAEGTADRGFQYPSRFIFNAELENLDFVVELQPYLMEGARFTAQIQEQKLREKQERIPIHTRICHPVFGNGVIQDIDEEAGCYIIQFDRQDKPRSILYGIDLKILELESAE